MRDAALDFLSKLKGLFAFVLLGQTALVPRLSSHWRSFGAGVPCRRGRLALP